MSHARMRASRFPASSACTESDGYQSDQSPPVMLWRGCSDTQRLSMLLAAYALTSSVIGP